MMKRLTQWIADRRDRRLREKLALKPRTDLFDAFYAYEFVLDPHRKAKYILSKLLTWEQRIPTLIDEASELVDKRIEEYQEEQRRKAEGSLTHKDHSQSECASSPLTK